MTKRVDDGTVGGYHAMLLNAEDDDPDRSFEASLKEIKLDTQGELVTALTVRGAYHLHILEHQLTPFR